MINTLMRFIYIVVLFGLIGCSSSSGDKTANLPDLPDPLEAGWKGKKVCEVLVDNADHRILKCVFPPGVGHEKHYHLPHTGYTLVGGQFEITDANGTRIVNVPTGYVFGNEDINIHQVKNVGKTTSEYLIIEPKK